MRLREFIMWPLLLCQRFTLFLPLSTKSSFFQRSIFRSEEHTSELQSLMRISYAVFCLQKKTKKNSQSNHKTNMDKDVSFVTNIIYASTNYIADNIIYNK